MVEDKIANYDVGCRVIVALNHPQENPIYLLGYGVYVSNEVPDEKAVGQFALHCRETGKLNPKILLDDGRVVWGSEVYWGEASVVEAALTGKKVVHCDLDTERQRAIDLATPLFGQAEPDMDTILAAAKVKASQLHG